MGESMLVGLWNVIIFFYQFLVKTIVYSIAEVLFQRAGIIALGALVLVAVGVIVVRARRR
jgi:positive regulator of sigma E activity